MVTELRKLGEPVVEHRDGLEISPAPIKPAAIDTYEDHRVAMAFSLVGLKVNGIRINDPECVSKTFPDYFSGPSRTILEVTFIVKSEDMFTLHTLVGGFCLGVSYRVASPYVRERASNYDIYYKRSRAQFAPTRICPEAAKYHILEEKLKHET